jgi:hypothetical protein
MGVFQVFQIKSLGFKLAPLLGPIIQVSDLRAIMALLFYDILQCNDNI